MTGGGIQKVGVHTKVPSVLHASRFLVELNRSALADAHFAAPKVADRSAGEVVPFDAARPVGFSQRHRVARSVTGVRVRDRRIAGIERTDGFGGAAVTPINHQVRP